MSGAGTRYEEEIGPSSAPPIEQPPDDGASELERSPTSPAVDRPSVSTKSQTMKKKKRRGRRSNAELAAAAKDATARAEAAEKRFDALEAKLNQLLEAQAQQVSVAPQQPQAAPVPTSEPASVDAQAPQAMPAAVDDDDTHMFTNQYGTFPLDAPQYSGADHEDIVLGLVHINMGEGVSQWRLGINPKSAMVWQSTGPRWYNNQKLRGMYADYKEHLIRIDEGHPPMQPMSLVFDSLPGVQNRW